MLERHPLSAAFPSMSASEQDELTIDIEKNGQREPIIIFGGMVLDGWHRYNSCSMLEIEPIVADLPSDVDPVAYVISRNIHRRHLTGSQRAAAIVDCVNWATSGHNQHVQKGGGEPGSPPPMTKEVMAKIAGVSEKTIQQAKTAHTAGLGDKIKNGEMSVKSACASIKPVPSTPVQPMPPSDPAPEKITILKSDYDELISLSEDLHAAQKDMESILESDYKLAGAAAEIRSLNEQVRVLRTRLQSEQNKNNELIKIVKGKDKQIAKLEKELETYKLDGLPI